MPTINIGNEWATAALARCASLYPVQTHQNAIEIAWLAGLLEGEAAFMISKNSPVIALQMSDEDIVNRVAGIMAVGGLAPWRPKKKEHYKQIFGCRIHGARAVVWMLILYPHLGLRRREKIREIVTSWEANAHPRAPRGQRWPALCHPDRPRDANGLCNTCYMREWRKKKRLQPQCTPVN